METRPLGKTDMQVSVLGFGLGYLVATLWSAHPLTLGGIPVVEASVGSLVLLVLASRFFILALCHRSSPRALVC